MTNKVYRVLNYIIITRDDLISSRDIRDMFLSVIIPVYNVENYLKQCVDSILTQTCRDFELILVDNGSTDSSGSICDEYQKQDDKVLVKHLMPNIMASGARNEGLKMASGDYILFIDSDDYYCIDRAFEMLKNKSSENSDVILFKSMDFYESNGKYGHCSYSFSMDTSNKTVEQICSELIDRDGYSNSAWSKAIKRSLLIDNDIWFTPGLSVEDNEIAFVLTVFIVHDNNKLTLSKVF